MAYVSAAPNFERHGVIAGFVLGLGTGLVPTITRGVLFLGSVMYRPALPPVLPAAPAGQQSWLYYGAGGFYWRGVPSPAASGDAFLGWVRTNSSAVIAVSAQQVLVPDVPTGTRVVVGLGPVTPIVPPPPGGDAPAAPNVTAATAAVVPETIAGEAWFHFGGTITLPTGDPNYAALRWIHIVAIGPDPLTDERPMGTIYVPEVAGGSVAWRSDAWRWPEGGGFWDFEFRCENTAGVVTAGPFRVEDVELVGLPAAPLNPDTVTAHEHVSERKSDANSLVYTPIDVEYTMPAGHNADYLMVWVTAYDGVGWDLAGKWWLTETIRFWRIVPAEGANWKVRVLSCRWDAENGTPLESAAFAVAAIANAKVNGITGASLGTVGYGTSATGTGTAKWWGIDSVQYTLPTQSADPNFWHSELTVFKCDVNGNPAPDYEGTERVVIAHDGFGRALDFPILWWTIPEPGSAYKYFRFKLYSVSRNETRVLQTTCWGGASYAQVVVEQPTPGSLDLSTIDPAAIGQGLVVEGGQLKATQQSNDNMVLNPSFESPLGAEWVAWGAVTDKHFRNVGGGHDSQCCLIITGASGGVKQGPIPAAAGDELYLTGWFYDDNVAGAPPGYLYFNVEAFNASDASIGSGNVTIFPGANPLTWVSKAVSYTCPAGTAYVKVNIVTDGGWGTPSGSWRADGLRMRTKVGSEVLKNQAVQAANMAANAVTAANQALAASSVVDSNMVSVSVSKLIAGTVIFTGDAVFSRGTGLPVQVLNNAGIYLFAVDAGGGIGAGNAPYVAIEGGGISLFAGASSRSVTLTSTALTLWSVGGNLSYPYVSVTSTGLTLSLGGSGASVSLAAAGITLANGSYSASVTASQIQLAVSGGASLILNATGLTIQAGSYSLAATASSLTLAYSGGASVQLTSAAISLTVNASNYVNIGSGTVSITLNGLSTSIQGNQLGTGTIFAASLILSPGTITLTNIGLPYATASAGGASLPSNPYGFIPVVVNGTTYKVPIYNV